MVGWPIKDEFNIEIGNNNLSNRSNNQSINRIMAFVLVCLWLDSTCCSRANAITDLMAITHLGSSAPLFKPTPVMSLVWLAKHQPFPTFKSNPLNTKITLIRHAASPGGGALIPLTTPGCQS